MTVGSVASTNAYSPATLKASVAASAQAAEGIQVADKSQTAKAGDSTVSISEEAKLMQVADAGKHNIEADEETALATKKAESFAYGALGMDHPDEVQQNTDDFYTAGQVLSALGTVATVLLAIA
ncbi:hypothetical protein [uncultured Photobacterium sp.]|uniref:hypothetical protein n=1 Tax=uncultured Photobacterium sp. TaxID=173973 RepID=UPI00262F00CF|nr:hypothetical protein [uncultured Photobacterium sp.]